ncbi:MAG: D-alanyl-D-alanine carboxypeptidase [Eubacterium sp.]|nr:D-alanyl-D-alanine carboxypeptidase [Eubacterium sp.]
MFKRFFILFLAVLLLPSYNVKASYISAKAYAVIDSANRTLLDKKNINKKMPMASTTKIMTCLIACESKRLNETVTITPLMLDKTEGTLINLKTGNRITLYDLVVGAMLASGNDAANSIAVYLSGNINDFCDKMNMRAKEIGMYNTHFSTPSGLDEGSHYSTAYDMALLGAEACRNDVLMSISKKKSALITIDYTAYNVYNHNKLLKSDSNFIGLKTGYTSKAGRCLVSVYNYRGSKIICVTLNAQNDWNDHKELIKKAKLNYKTYQSNEKCTLRTLEDGNKYLDCSYCFTVSALKTVWVKIYYYPIVYPPVRRGEVIGYVEIYSSDELINKVDLISQENLNG